MDDAWVLAEGQHPQMFRGHVKKAAAGDAYRFDKALEMDFLLFLPQGYKDRGQKWPLIVFMHGSGESGADLALLKRHGLPKIVAQQADFPFIVISPQARSVQQGFEFDLDALNGLLEQALAQLPIDPARIYLTGMSMGGYAAWGWAAACPGRFAAIAPVCGGWKTSDAPALKHMPVWAFHGALDDTVPLGASVAMVDAVNAEGGHAELTVYAQSGHDAWTETYANPALYAWFLQHARPVVD